MSSSSIRTVPGPGSSVLLSFTLKLSSHYPLPQTQASSSHAAHSLRQASARRSQDCTRRCGGNGVFGGTLGSLNRRALRRHAPRSLRRWSARRSRKGTGLLGGCGAVGEVLVQHPSQGVIRHAPRYLRLGSARRSQERRRSYPSGGKVLGVTSPSHAAHFLRQGSARRLQDCTRRCGGSGVFGGTLGSLNRRALCRLAPRSLRR